MFLYDNMSPYSKTEVVNNYLDVINFRDFPPENDDVMFEITATYEYRPDLLSYDLYKTPNLWWVFSVRNKSVLKDPIFDMTAGTKIFIPKFTTLKKYLGV